jgi:acetylornithine deacetylase/succinyl-diaminopimelate desuccinylase-like protein
MAVSQVQRDVYYLAGHLTHRAANTESERAAAEYIRGRLAERTPLAEIDDFYSPDNPWYLFASYYGEFIIVSLVAFWVPGFAAVYGGIVFISYLAEYMGFPVMSRFLPHYETQNVLATFLNPGARKSLVFVAHYDSGKEGPLSISRFGRALGYLHTAAAPLMLYVVATCVEQWLFPDGALQPQMVATRWTAATLLFCLAALVTYNEMESDYTAGANDNASGTAALLRVAEHLPEEVFRNCAVHFVAAGSNQNWMSGARHFIRYHKLDPDATEVIVIDSVGRGELWYTTRLGMVQTHACGKDLVAAAESAAAEYDAAPIVKRTPNSDAVPFLAHGYKAMEITASYEPDGSEDILPFLDYNLIVRAADFAITIGKTLSANQANLNE